MVNLFKGGSKLATIVHSKSLQGISMKQELLIVSEKAKQFTKILQTESETFIVIPESQVLKNVS